MKLGVERWLLLAELLTTLQHSQITLFCNQRPDEYEQSLPYLWECIRWSLNLTTAAILSTIIKFKVLPRCRMPTALFAWADQGVRNIRRGLLPSVQNSSWRQKTISKQTLNNTALTRVYLSLGRFFTNWHLWLKICPNSQVF